MSKQNVIMFAACVAAFFAPIAAFYAWQHLTRTSAAEVEKIREVERAAWPKFDYPTNDARTTSATPSLDQKSGGQAIFEQTCVGCHHPQSLTAPPLTQHAWAERLTQGRESLHRHAIDGFHGTLGVMPAKGGNASLSEQQIRAAVDWMLDNLEADSSGRPMCLRRKSALQ